MLAPYFLNAGGPPFTVKSCRAFRVKSYSFGATFSINGGIQQSLVAGEVYPLQPEKGDDSTTGLFKSWPDVIFTPGATTGLGLICDIEDGNMPNPLALGLGPTIPSVQDGEQIPAAQGGSTPTGPATPGGGILGVLSMVRTPSGASIGNPNLITEAIGDGDLQIFDQTAGAGAALNAVLGTNSTTVPSRNYRHYLVRVSGLTAPTARVFTYSAERNDSSFVVLAQFTAAGTITDLLVSCGTGETGPAAPGPTTEEAHYYGWETPTLVQFNLSAAGADTPRMTIWGRSGS